MEKRTFYNPKIKDKVTIVMSPKETNNEYMLLEIELEPKGGNGLHYHTAFTEEFTALVGDLGVRVGNKKMILSKGEKATVEINQRHHFFNPGDRPISFQVKLVPGHEGFLQGLKIAYGLATDGLTTDSGMPKKIDHLAVVMDLSATYAAGFLSFLTPLFKKRAQGAKKRGVYDELVKRYC